eukprot:6200855-Pleurochrysis_carterae.AAC.2
MRSQLLAAAVRTPGSAAGLSSWPLLTETRRRKSCGRAAPRHKEIRTQRASRTLHSHRHTSRGSKGCAPRPDAPASSVIVGRRVRSVSYTHLTLPTILLV